MTIEMEDRHREAVILTRGIENILRKLAKFLVGRISLIKLQEILKLVFVEAIENKLQEENPQKTVSLTQMALLSGLDTRTITKIRNEKKYRQPLHQENTFLEDFIPGASILDTWCSKEPYVNKETGEPIELDVTGKISFESLFNDSTKSRGITFKSLLKRLVESKSVQVNKSNNTVKLLSNSYLPTKSKDNEGAIEMGFSAIGNLIDTVTRNICSADTGADRFYQRGAWTYRLSAENKSKLRSELKKLLETTDSEARSIIKNNEDKHTFPGSLTAGVSLFYFEETGFQ